ncbi:cytochrome b/b6 domain-containing protein [Pseudoalteromonas piscicida]|uniref:Cytochrome n=1 Tax=Pseudoalteromonas piscicida TaxID=43662 RepID=A0A2A5JW79_PSEO7|nr:cytochrome b/b6 domain-containing protein [Pseudoalteromonas piscicida]PCK33715.1 cytochrome [Pseudoalteromonas piscicida]
MTKVWDGFIRGFHWLLVAGLVTLYITGEEGMMDLHFITGYLLLALMAARLVWGVIGSQTAKISALFHSPKAILAAIKSKQSHVGHNPAGSLMVLLFFVLIIVQLVSGLMTTDDILVEGPLAQYVSYDMVELAGDIHHSNVELLIAAIVLHIVAIVVYRLKGQNLVKTLLTGKQEHAVSTPAMKSGLLAYVIFIALSVLLLLTWGAEPLQSLL